MTAERHSPLSHAPAWFKTDLKNYELKELNKKLGARAAPGAAGPAIRLSSAGACERALWYKSYHPEESEGLDARAFANFELGDAIEQRVKYWLAGMYGEKYRGFRLVCHHCKTDRRVYTPRCPNCDSGDYDEYEDQCKFPVPMTPNSADIAEPKFYEDVAITMVGGRVDGILDCPDGVTRLVEIKSAANYTFFQAKPTEDAEGKLSYAYACQQTAYLAALGLEESLVLFVRKETADVAPSIFRIDKNLIKEIQTRFRNVLQAGADNACQREYAPVPLNSKMGAPDGLWKLNFPCSYCEFKGACYPTFKTEFVKSRDYASGTSVLKPTSVDRTHDFKTPEEAQRSTRIPLKVVKKA